MPTRTIPGQRRQTHPSVTPVLIPRSTIERPVMASKENTSSTSKHKDKGRGGGSKQNNSVRNAMKIAARKRKNLATSMSCASSPESGVVKS